MAQGSLFSWLSDDIFRRPTFSRFCALLDNCNPHQGYKEELMHEEKQDQAAFIEEIGRTAPVKYLTSTSQLRQLAQAAHQVPPPLVNMSSLEKSSTEGKKKFLASITGFSFTLKRQKEGLTIKVTSSPEGEEKFSSGMVFSNLCQALWLKLSPEFEVPLYTVCFCLVNHIQLGPYP
ncbi:EndoU ribonuclease, C-terminal, partial [Dillenia turbinata]